MLAGREPYPPYERPALSKEFLTKGVPPEDLQLRPQGQWRDLDIELITGEGVEAVSVSEGCLELTSGRRLTADRLVLCTGGRSRPLGIAGERLPGVYHLRDIADAEALRSVLHERARVVIVGGGFVGAETAASAATLGCDVTILEVGPTLMIRGLGVRWGTLVAEEHRRQGVTVRTDTSVRQFLGRDRVHGVELADGERIDADVVIVGVGMTPAVELALDASLAIDNGIVVDEGGRTSNPHVFAAGDVTNQPGWRGIGRRRLESFQNAQDQAESVAAALLGQPLPERDVPWFWSDQFEYNIQTAGHLATDGELVLRGAEDSSSFTAFHLREGVLSGVFAINGGRDVRGAMRLIASGQQLDAASLADPSVDLRHLVAAR